MAGGTLAPVEEQNEAQYDHPGMVPEPMDYDNPAPNPLVPMEDGVAPPPNNYTTEEGMEGMWWTNTSNNHFSMCTHCFLTIKIIDMLH